MEKMCVKSVCLVQLDEMKSFWIRDRPRKALLKDNWLWFHTEKHIFKLMYRDCHNDSSIMEVEGEENTDKPEIRQVACFPGEILCSSVHGSSLYCCSRGPDGCTLSRTCLLTESNTCMTSFRGNFDASNTWLLCIDGWNLSDEFFDQMVSSNNEQLRNRFFILVGSSEATLCLDASMQVRKLDQSWSQIDFLKHFLRLCPERVLPVCAAFAGLPQFLRRPTKVKEAIHLEAEVKDVLVEENSIGILYRSGELWSYSATSRSLLMCNVEGALIVDNKLTVLTGCGGVYHGLTENFAKFRHPLPGCSDQEDKLQEILRISREVQRLGLATQQQRANLSQLQLFTQVLDKIPVFECRVELQNKELKVGGNSTRLLLKLTVATDRLCIEPDFFALETYLRLGDQLRSQTTNICQRMSRGDSLLVSLDLLSLSIADFPLLIGGKLLLKGERLGVPSALLLSAEVFQERLGPLEMLRPQHLMSSPPVQVTGKASTRDYFLALLDTDPEKTATGHKPKAATRLLTGLDVSALKNNFTWAEALVDLHERGNSLQLQLLNQVVTFTFLKKNEWRVSCSSERILQQLITQLLVYVH